MDAQNRDGGMTRGAQTFGEALGIQAEQRAPRPSLWRRVGEAQTFGVVSSHKRGQGEEANRARLAALVTRVRAMGYGHILMRAGHIYPGGHFSHRKSLLIPGINRVGIMKLGLMLDQKCVIHRDGDEFALIGLRDSNFGIPVLRFTRSASQNDLEFCRAALTRVYPRLTSGRRGIRRSPIAFRIQEREPVNVWIMMGMRARDPAWRPGWVTVHLEEIA